MLPLPYKLFAAALALASAVAFGGYLTHRWDAGQYAIKEAKAEAEATRAAQQAFATYQSDVLKTSVAAATAQATADALRDQISATRDLYARLPKSAVDLNCKLSDQRLRAVQSAVAATGKGPVARIPLNPVPSLGRPN